MAGGGKADADLISFFKKFSYGTEHFDLKKKGYRLATVYETEQLLKAIRSTKGGGKKLKAEEWNVVEHELVPEGEEEAYRLKDGYLLDFGTLRTFYRDTSDKFRITHKLCVSLSLSGLDNTRSIKLWLPLALLHACAEEDVDEIKDLVINSTQVQRNIVEMNLVSTTMEDDVLVQMQDSTSTESVQESTHGMASTSTTSGDDDERKRKAAANRRLALLCSGTPWLNGGTALHFCAWAGKRVATKTLEDLASMYAEKDENKKYEGMLFCKDNESNNAFSLAVAHSESAFKERFFRLLADDEMVTKRMVRHVNVFGSSSVLCAAQKGHLETFIAQAYSWIALDHPLKSVREFYPHLFNQLDGNSFLHYLVLRPDFNTGHMDRIQSVLDGSTPPAPHTNYLQSRMLPVKKTMCRYTLAEFAFGIENHTGSTAFQVALSQGRSEVCEWLLHRYRGSPPEFASRALAFRDCKGRNMLHLYAEGGADKKVGKMILRNLRAVEAEPTDLSLPLFLRRAKDAAKIKDLLNELNADGHTPCTVALNEGHSDAFQMLMQLWEKELAAGYRHFVTQENILHIYATSTHPGRISFEWSSFFSAPALESLLIARNRKGYTPLISALYESCCPGANADTAAVAWLLQRAGDRIDIPDDLRPDAVLDWYANHFDDEVQATQVLQKLGRDVEGGVEPLENKITSALKTAIRYGHARTCYAFLEALGKSYETPDDDALLKALLEGMDQNLSENPLGVWEKLKTYGINESKLVDFVIAEPSTYRGAILGALYKGNIEACKWLLECSEANAGKGAISGCFKEEGFTERAFKGFARSNCKDQNLWDKLRKCFDLTLKSPPSTSSAASSIHDKIQTLLKEIRKDDWRIFSNHPSEDCALCFLRDPGLVSSTLGWMSPTSLKSFKVLAHMRRHKNYCHIFHCSEILQLATKLESFELFDMALQVQAQQQNQGHFLIHNDKLITTIISQIPLSSSDCFLQVLSMRLAEEKCSPLVISWKRLVEDRKNGRGNCKVTKRGPKPWLWASVHSSSNIWDESADTVESIAGVEKRETRHAASRLEEPKAGEQRKMVSQVRPLLTEKLQDAYLSFAQKDFSFSECDQQEVLALGNIIVKQGPSSIRSNASQLLREMRRPGSSTVLSQMLFLISHDRNDDAAPGIDVLLPELLNACTLPTVDILKASTGELLQTLLHQAITHQKSFFFLKFKKFLASSAALWTEQDQNTVQNRATTLLHHLVYNKGEGDSSPFAKEIVAGTVINALHYFRFFQVEGVRDHTGATALHVACRQQNEMCTHVLLAMCPHLATLGHRNGKTALHDSAHSGYLQIVEEILRFRTDANALLDERDADGKTALHFAAASPSPNSLEIVKLLLGHAERNGNYAALLLWASAGSAVGTADRIAKDRQVKHLLQQEMSNVSKTVPNLLELAISQRSDSMMRELINRGAQIKPEFLKNIQEILDTTKESDQPAKADSLGRGPLAKGIAALLLNPFTAVPITVGVLGPWGMGKSSVMLQTEIAMMMTMIESNLLPMEPSSTEDAFPGCREQKEDMTLKGKEVCRQLRTALQQQSQQHASMLRSRQQKKLSFWSSWTKRTAKIKEDKNETLQNFVSHYNNDLKPLYKGVSLLDRQDLFQCSNSFEQMNAIKVPSCITIMYNAWLYFGEKEASSGLAFTILKELEECLNTAQWLRLCWRYAYKADAIFFFSNITLPLFVWIAIGGWVLWIMWELFSIPSIANNQALDNFKYGSLPIAMIISTWVVLRNVLNVVKPVSEQVFKSLHRKSSYEVSLGYHQQIIDDIEFFKDELCEVPSFGWKCCGKVWSTFIENKDNITPTKIKKALIYKKSLRIIVFVDDLDRCTEPTYILQLLGAINLILSACSINVIIGMDKGMVEEVLKSAYQGNMESTQKFLEKIIQLPIYLNEASEQEMSNFVQEHIFGRYKSTKSDSTSSKRTKDLFTTRTTSPSASTSNENHSNEDTIAIVTESSLHPQEIKNGQRNNLSSEADLSSASISDVQDESSYKKKSSNDAVTMRQHVQDFIELEGDDKLAIKRHLLVPNYTRRELETFQYLQSRAKVENRQPRNWKRFLNYHRLSWYIISQTKSRVLRFFNGWQEQLIIWVFICYNWELEMSEIFQNWKTLLEEISPEATNDPITLHQLISLHMKKKKDRKNEEEVMKEWEQLADTTSTIHDIDINIGIFFQNYRFHCATNQLYWENN